MTGYTNQEWILQKRPDGLVKRSDFEFRQSPLRARADGECVVKIMYMAMDPATRGWMSESGGYTVPLPLGQPVLGVIIGKVIESRNPLIAVGTVVAGVGPWAKYFIAGPEQISAVRTGAMGVLAPMDTSSGHELPMYMHALGTSGGTAYYGLFVIGAMKAGETVLVSGATGSVGQLVTQMAKIKGAKRVVGIAGGAAKCAEAVRDYGCDACIDYKATKDINAAIRKECPEGVDVYFDNVGGDILEAALDNLRKWARVPICGMISKYNDSTPSPGPKNVWNLLVYTARMEGFLVSDYFGSPECEAAYADMARWMSEGKLKAKLDIRPQFDQVPEIFTQLFTGGNDGRLIVQVPD